MASAHPLVFDGHNDVLLRLWQHDPGDSSTFINRIDNGHIDLPRAREGGFGGGLFAVFVPSLKPETDPASPAAGLNIGKGPVDRATSQRVLLEMAARLYRLEAAGGVRVCRTVGEIESAMEAGEIAAVFHIEGAEAIGLDLYALDVLYAAGLRSLGPVWSRGNGFGEGVPFGFNMSPDTGPGLTDAGKALVRRCNELRILLDVSHLNEKGFWDLAAIAEQPFVASHSNAHALVPSSRNLTDRQLDALRDRDGLVGVNLSVPDLRDDGRRDRDTPMSMIVRQFDYLIEKLGEDRVGFGNDMDGATIPAVVGDVAGLPRMLDALEAHGYDQPLLAKLAHGNWLSLLRRVWGA